MSDSLVSLIASAIATGASEVVLSSPGAGASNDNDGIHLKIGGTAPLDDASRMALSIGLFVNGSILVDGGGAVVNVGCLVGPIILASGSLVIVNLTFSGQCGDLSLSPIFHISENADVAAHDVMFVGVTSPLFLVDGGTMIMSRVHVTNVHTDGQSLIHLRGSAAAFLSNATFAAVSASGPGAVFRAEGMSSLTLLDSEFVNISATASSGAAYFGSGACVLTVSRTVITGADTPKSGAVFAITESCVAHISDSTIQSVRALKQGGVMLVADMAAVSLHRVLMNTTSAGAAGGAIAMWDSASVSATNCTFLNLLAQADSPGGVISATESSILALSGCSVDGAAAGTGGVVAAFDSASVSINGGVFSRLSASRSGAFATVYSDAKIVLDGAVIFGVSAGISGAVFRVWDAGIVIMTTCRIRDASCLEDGAVVLVQDSGYVAMTDSVVLMSVAIGNGGVGVALGSSVIESSGCVYQGASSGNAGGAFYAYDDALIQSDGDYFADLSAVSGGVGLFYKTSRGIFRDSVIRFVSVDVFGGLAAVTDDARVDFVNGSVRDVLTNNGGGVYVDERGVLKLQWMSLDFMRVGSSNSAALGAALTRGSLLVVDCVVTDMLADDAGSLYADGYGDILVVRTFVSNSRSGLFGAGGFAILQLNSRMHVRDSVIVDGWADYHGGVLSLAGNASATIEGSEIIRPQSGGVGGVASIYDTAALLMRNCQIVNAASNLDGGAVALYYQGFAHFENVTFGSSLARHMGGVVSVSGSASIHMVGCSILTSSAEDFGGAFACAGASADMASSVTVIDTLVRSSFSRRGGGVLYATSCKVALLRVRVFDTAAVPGIESDAFVAGDSFGFGGVFLLQQGSSLMSHDCRVGSSESVSGGGGLVAVLSNSSCSFFNLTGTGGGSAAVMGGVAFVSRGSRLDLVSSTLVGGSAQGNGGCFYVSRGSFITMREVVISACIAGADRASYGSGGLLYAEENALVTGESFASVHVGRAMATRGSVVFTYQFLVGLFNNASRLSVGSTRAVVDMSAALLQPWLPVEWSPGGYITSSPAAFAIPVTCVGVPGGEVEAFSVEIRDAYGYAVSIPPAESPSLRLVGGMPAPSGSHANSVPPSAVLRGQIERVFGSSASVSVVGFRAFGHPGTYVVSLQPANLMYDASRPPFSNASMILKLLDCPSEAVLSTTADGLDACVAVTSQASSFGTDLAVGLSLGIGLPVILGALLFVAYRRGLLTPANVDRQGREAFLAEYVAKRPSLAAVEVPRDAIHLLNELGRGEFGVVYRANIVCNGRPRQCAAKLIRESSNFQARVDFFREAEVMLGLPLHENVVQCAGVSLAQEPMLMLMEYVAAGTLGAFVAAIPWAHRSGPHIREMFATFARGIAAGMAHLAYNRIVHRDLAARNVLVGTDVFGEYVVKISDFGLARTATGGGDGLYQKSKGGRLPVKWLCPESMRTGVFTSKSDVWAYGVVLWELYSFGSAPYPSVPNAQIRAYLDSGHRLERPQMCPVEIYGVMLLLWASRPEQRPTFKAIMDALDGAVPNASTEVRDNVLGEESLTPRYDNVVNATRCRFGSDPQTESAGEGMTAVFGRTLEMHDMRLPGGSVVTAASNPLANSYLALSAIGEPSTGQQYDNDGSECAARNSGKPLFNMSVVALLRDGDGDSTATPVCIDDSLV